MNNHGLFNSRSVSLLYGTIQSNIIVIIVYKGPLIINHFII